jgi:hypothetical protein
MKLIRFVSAVAVAGLAATATVASAQYPIPSKTQFKCQSSTSKASAKFIGAKAKCIVKCTQGAVKGSNPFSDCDAPYAGATQFCIGDVVKGAQTKLAAGIVKGCTKAPADCPTCYSGGDCSVTGQAAATVANLEFQLDAFTPAVACEDTTDKAQSKCITSNASLLSKFVGAKNKCYDKCYSSWNSGKISGGCLPPATDPATVACISKAAGKAAASFDKACPGAAGPPPAAKPACYDDAVPPPALIPRPSTGAGWVALVELSVDATIPGTYCGSPSGAFID